MPSSALLVEREHGTRLRYLFGPAGSDPANGCRGCTDCKAANTAYQRRRTGVDPGRFVDAGPVIEHLAAVRDRWRLSQHQLSELTGLERSGIRDLLSGARRTVLATTAAKVGGLSLDERPWSSSGRVDAAETWRLVGELRQAGWSQARVALALGLGKDLQLSRDRVYVRTATRVRELHAGVVAEVLVGLLGGTVLHLAHALYLERQSWRSRAACHDPKVDPEIFFPERGESCGPAKAVCRACPVRSACLAENITERFGVWGGLSERERRRLRRTRKVAAVAEAV